MRQLQQRRGMHDDTSGLVLQVVLKCGVKAWRSRESFGEKALLQFCLSRARSIIAHPTPSSRRASSARTRATLPSCCSNTHSLDAFSVPSRARHSSPLVYSRNLSPTLPCRSNPCQMCLKCADLGHLATSPKDVHMRWVQLLEEEVRGSWG